MKRIRIVIKGRVQGVGFRPFVFREAQARQIQGSVANTSEGVFIEAQADEASLNAFLEALKTPPPLALITAFSVEAVQTKEAETGFAILESPQKGDETGVLVSPDVSICPECLRELFDPSDRRYLYPFINCTNCGPRFTLTRQIPYDRKNTSMSCFPLCPECSKEYTDPNDRRFHAQPDACPKCGPRLWIARPNEDSKPTRCVEDFITPIREAVKAVFEGKILAMKGLGGFHLVCNARDANAVQKLRLRKARPHKALAVMVEDEETLKTIAFPTEKELELLKSRVRPIVLMKKRLEADGGLPENIAPDTDMIGVMMPYVPLQYVFFHCAKQHTKMPIFVMTSGNAKGCPICLGNREALKELEGIADLFLLHDRDILVRADDSVVKVADDGKIQLFRRSRGFVPSPLPLPFAPQDNLSIIAVGADLKNTATITRGRDAFSTQYIGDLGNPETNAFAFEAQKHLKSLLGVKRAGHIVCDLHPDFYSRKIAESIASEYGAELHTLQHHAAHFFSVLGENGCESPSAGLILDGTGFGSDGTVWGGELLLCDGRSEWRRIGRISPFLLAGGERAIREPWRILCSMAGRLRRVFPLTLTGVPEAKIRAVEAVSRANIGIETSSCGRLFDVASALLGLCSCITYEGQAAIRLESIQNNIDEGKCQEKGFTPSVAFKEESGLWEMDAYGLIEKLFQSIEEGVSVPVLARFFHISLAKGLAELVRLAVPADIKTIALSGGVFLNATMLYSLRNLLEKDGFSVIRNVRLSPGDENISYGQTTWFVKKMMALEKNKP